MSSLNIKLFNKKYWLRRFGEQREVKGYLTASYQDRVVSLNVHPLGNDAIQALPEGERSIKHLEGHGDYDLVAGSESLNKKGDLLLYKGDWYECISCKEFDHTILSHFNYQFVIVPADGSGKYDINNPPVGNPEVQEESVML